MSTHDDDRTPYEILGEESVRKLAESFYAIMARDEPALARLHELEPDGTIVPEMRERFFWFLSGWLGGPPIYMERIGHPRLRMRHAHVPIDEAMRDAWMRAMNGALDGIDMPETLREFLKGRFEHVATFLINRAPDETS